MCLINSNMEVSVSYFTDLRLGTAALACMTLCINHYSDATKGGGGLSGGCSHPQNLRYLTFCHVKNLTNN